jgi:HSP20 family protein
MRNIPMSRASDLFDRLGTLSSLLNEAFYPEIEEESGKYAWVPSVDITETLNDFKVLVELSGVKKEDVQVNLENNVLTISGERNSPVVEKDTQNIRTERYYGLFKRIFRLSELVSEDGIKADLKEGVLTITIPKAEKAKPKEIPIKVQ